MRIKELEIKNFKSIRELNFPCSRVNLFIGPPNGGKSNILESLSLISWMQHIPGGYGIFNNKHAFDWLRAKECPRLFYGYDTSSQEIRIKATLTPAEDERDHIIHMRVKSIRKEAFRFSYAEVVGRSARGNVLIVSSPDFSLMESGTNYIKHVFIRFYRYPPVLEERLTAGVRNLLPPIGRNISEVFLSGENKRLMEAVEPMLEELGFEPALEPKRYAFQMKRGGRQVLFELYQVSDTFKRMLFHLAAVLTNDDSVVTLEEPEAHAFPEYLATLSEQIAQSNNQFFITTHSPEVIYTLARNVKEGEFACFVVILDKKRGTQLKKIPHTEVLNYATNILANLDDYIEEERH